jgi:hypothetical protein
MEGKKSDDRLFSSWQWTVGSSQSTLSTDCQLPTANCRLLNKPSYRRDADAVRLRNQWS